MRALLIISLLLSFTCRAQLRFEKVDSVSKDKNQIYSDTKMFIAKTWRSSKDVIQNDDKEAGVIIVKGISLMKSYFMMNYYYYDYRYMVTFRFKDNKFKVTIDNIYCDRAYGDNQSAYISKIEPFEGDNCPETGTISHPGVPRKKAKIMMQELRNELQSIVDSYSAEIKSAKPAGDW